MSPGHVLRTLLSGQVLRTASAGHVLRTASAGHVLRTASAGQVLRTASAKLLVLRAVLIVRTAERDRRRTLERELAAFATPAQRAELEAILGRHTAEQAREVWSIVNRQAPVQPYRPHRGQGRR